MDRVCLFAHFNKRNELASYVVNYVAEIHRAGFRTIFISTSALTEDSKERLRPICPQVLVRENIGLDFGSWAHAYRTSVPQTPDLLLLTNDSVYGPLTDLGAFIDRLTEPPADAYGAVRSIEMSPHLQSWFLLLRKSALRSNVFQELMTNPPHRELSKFETVVQYELGLSSGLEAEGHKLVAAYDATIESGFGEAQHFNPTNILWRELITYGRVPFVKVDLLRDNVAGLGRLTDLAKLVPGNPEILRLVQEDLRHRAEPRDDSLPARLGRSLPHPSPTFWPELHPLFRLDFLLHRRSSRLSALNRLAFRVARKASGSIRRARLRLIGKASGL